MLKQNLYFIICLAFSKILSTFTKENGYDKLNHIYSCIYKYESFNSHIADVRNFIGEKSVQCIRELMDTKH